MVLLLLLFLWLLGLFMSTTNLPSSGPSLKRAKSSSVCVRCEKIEIFIELKEC